MDTVTPTPAASVLIPTKNRKQMLLDTVHSVLRQSVPVEVIIVDDGSTDGTTDLVRSAFDGDTRVILIRHEDSRGPTAARNEAALQAKSPYLFTIDDDCLVPSPNTFEQTIASFDHPRVGAVTIPFINVHQNNDVRFRAPASDDCYVGFLYFGGMVAFRKSIFLSLGGYRAYYFMQVEEPDMIAQLFREGYIVRLGTADPIDHLESPVRESKRRLLLEGRNHVLYYGYNTPMPDLLLRVPVTAVATMRKAIKAGRPDVGLLGVVRGLAGLWNERERRRPLPRQLWRLLRQQRFSTPRLSELEPFLPPPAFDRSE